MTIFEEMDADIAMVFAVFGKDVIWKGQSLKAMISDPAIGQEFVIGGFADTGNFTIKLLRTALGNAIPKHGDIIEYTGDRFRVTRVTNRPPHPLVILVVGNVDE